MPTSSAFSSHLGDTDARSVSESSTPARPYRVVASAAERSSAAENALTRADMVRVCVTSRAVR